MKIFVFIFILFLSQPLFAQRIFKGATIYTGKGETVKQGTLLLNTFGHISVVSTEKAFEKTPFHVDSVGLVYDCSDKFITPGFIDAGTDLGLTEIWAVKASNHYGAGDLDRDKDFIQSGYLAADGFNPNAMAIPLTRSGGVTSVVTHPSGRIISGQSAWADLGPQKLFNAKVTNPSVAIHVSMNSRAAKPVGGSTASVVLLLKEAFDDTKYLMQNKKELDGTRAKKSSLSRQDVLALQKALDKKIPIVFSVSRAVDILSAIKLSKTYGFQLIVSGGEEAWMVADELAKAKVPVMLDPYKNLPTNFDKLGTRIDNAALLHKAKVEIMLSTFEAHNVRNLRFSAGNAVRAGLPYQAALTAITSTPAKYFGAKKLGSLEPGKMGNFVIWSGDPFEPSSFVEAMFINGRSVNLDNRQEALFRKYRKLNRRGSVPAKVEKKKKKQEKKVTKE